MTFRKALVTKGNSIFPQKSSYNQSGPAKIDITTPPNLTKILYANEIFHTTISYT
jgi:hypothetical protein